MRGSVMAIFSGTRRMMVRAWSRAREASKNGGASNTTTFERFPTQDRPPSIISTSTLPTAEFLVLLGPSAAERRPRCACSRGSSIRITATS